MGVCRAVLGALWSELGKWERGGEGTEVGVRATGTGVIFEQKREEEVLRSDGEFEYESGTKSRKSVLAVGVEPQILSGEKRGPYGMGSEPIGMDVDVDHAGGVGAGVKEAVGGYVEEGKKQVEGFTVVRAVKQCHPGSQCTSRLFLACKFRR
jgi:hypothetical protein